MFQGNHGDVSIKRPRRTRDKLPDVLECVRDCVLWRFDLTASISFLTSSMIIIIIRGYELKCEQRRKNEQPLKRIKLSKNEITGDRIA